MFSLPTLKDKKVATYIIAPELLISVPCRDVVFRNNCTKIKQVLSCCWIDCWIYSSLVLTIILLILRVKCCELDYMLYTLFCTCFKSEVNEEKKETVAIFFLDLYDLLRKLVFVLVFSSFSFFSILLYFLRCLFINTFCQSKWSNLEGNQRKIWPSKLPCYVCFERNRVYAKCL